MLTFILFISIAAISFGLLALTCSLEKKYKTDPHYSIEKADTADKAGNIFAGIFIICLVVVLAILFAIAIIHIPDKVQTIKLQNEYEILTAQLEKSEDDPYLIQEIVTYNNRILNERWLTGNLWINWIGQKCIAELPLIEIQ